MKRILFGIPNCDSCKKARKWLDSHDIAYTFYDVRADGLTKKDVHRWVASIDWKKLLNTRSTTWRNLPDATRTKVNESNVVKLLVDNPTLVKRPVLEEGDTAVAGFSESSYAERYL